MLNYLSKFFWPPSRRISSFFIVQVSFIYSDKINNLPIGKLVLPGTHNAGAWRFDTEISTATRDSFILCQDRSIWAQLVHGIRYFDFRVSYYETYPNVEDR